MAGIKEGMVEATVTAVKGTCEELMAAAVCNGLRGMQEATRPPCLVMAVVDLKRLFSSWSEMDRFRVGSELDHRCPMAFPTSNNDSSSER